MLDEGAVGDAVQSEQQQGSPQLQGDQWCPKDAGSRAAPCLGSGDSLDGVVVAWDGSWSSPSVEGSHLDTRHSQSASNKSSWIFWGSQVSLDDSVAHPIPCETWGFCPTQLQLMVIQPP